MRALLTAALILLPIAAHADRYAQVCAAPCVASDGTTQAAGTTIGIVMWDGVTPFPQAGGVSLVPFSGQVPYGPTVVGTTLTRAALLARFTTAEKAAIATAAGTIDSDAWVILHIHLNLTTTLDLSTSQMQQDFATLVTDGLLTQARATQIMNLGMTSP
jgi:hypothetical protein